MAVLDGRLLLAEKDLGGAQPQGVIGAVEQVTQDHVRQLVEEHRRDVDRRLEQAHVAAFDRAGVEQLLAELEYYAVVVPGILVFNGIELCRRNGSARLPHQGLVKVELPFSRLLDRMDLRAQVIGAQEVVGDPQAARGVPF